MHSALSTYNVEFVALAVGTMNLVEWKFLLTVRVVVVLVLSIVVSTRLLETTLFRGKNLM